MARSLWKGAINFGLVHIPIRIWKATRPQQIRFRELHDKDHVPLKQKRVCPEDGGKEVSKEHVAKGFEISPGRFIVLEPKELQSLEPEAEHSIDIENFVSLDEVDPIYFETAYYLTPDRGAGRPWMLLKEALDRAGKAAIARIVIRTREHLVLLRGMEQALVMSTMLFADEIVDLNEIPAFPKGAEPTKQELDMALKLIESMTVDFQPEAYHDKYREKVLELIEKKAKGQKLPTPRQAKKPAKVIDLVEALQASLGQSPGKSKRETASKKTGDRASAARKSRKKKRAA